MLYASLFLAFASAVSALRVGAPATGVSRSREAQCSIAVFGASGGTGSEAVLQALERGEDVTCLVRDRSKLKAPRSAAGFSADAPFVSDKLSVKQGSVTSKVQSALRPTALTTRVVLRFNGLLTTASHYSLLTLSTTYCSLRATYSPPL